MKYIDDGYKSNGGSPLGCDIGVKTSACRLLYESIADDFESFCYDDSILKESTL